MSSIWTPGGEHEVPRDREEAGGPPPQAPPSQGTGAGREPSEAEMAEQLQAMQEQLLSTPAAVVVANHAFGLFELAALHLGVQPPNLEQAQLAIDALGALVEGLPGRLGEYEAQLAEGLSQLRLAYVQIRAAAAQAPPAGEASPGAGAPGPAAAGEDVPGEG